MDNALSENAPQGEEAVVRRSHARKYTVKTLNSLSDRIDGYYDFSESVKGYATAIKKNILFRCFNNQGFYEDNEQEDGRLVIYFSATPLPDEKWKKSDSSIITKVFETELGRRTGIFEPSDDKKYFNMYDYDGSKVVAQFSENSIYILFNLLRSDERDTRFSLFKIIFDKYLEYRKAVRLNKLDKFIEENEKQRQLIFRRNFSKFYLGEIGSALESAKKEGNKSEKEIIETRNTLTNQIQKHKFIQAKIAGFTQIIAKLDETVIKKQYDELCKLSINNEIFLNEGTIIVPIGQIDIEYEGVIYDIGDFDVIINTIQSGNYISCINKTRTVNGDYHPHVTCSGSVCLGTIEEIIPQLITGMEYAAVVRIMIDFLHSYNPNDPYEDVESWPVKVRKEAQYESDNQP